MAIQEGWVVKLRNGSCSGARGWMQSNGTAETDFEPYPTRTIAEDIASAATGATACKVYASRAVGGSTYWILARDCTPKEERVVDPTTGGEKGSKLERYDLIPAEPLRLLAEHYGKGNQKYSSQLIIVASQLHEECSCGNQIAIQSFLTTLRASAETVTKNISDKLIKNLQSANVKIVEIGWPKIKLEFAKKPSLGDVQSLIEHACEPNLNFGVPEDSLRKWLKNFYLQQTISALSVKTSSDPEVPTWTMTIRLDSPEDLFVHGVIKVWDCSEIRKNLLAEHSNTCKIHRLRVISNKLISVNERNWEKGYKWSLSFAAMMRHAWAFWRGEDIDAETGSPHLVAVAWHAFCLLEFTRRHPTMDDRSK